MLARGCIAIKTKDGWRGIYNHWDSYPSWLGKELWDFIKRNKAEAIAKAIEQHPGGFRSFPSECYCHSEFSKKNGSCAKDSPLYNTSTPSGIIDSQNANPLFVEWVYIIDPDKQTMTILTNQSDNMTNGIPRGEKAIKRNDGYYDYGHCAFRHVEVAKINLRGREPDWFKVERKNGNL